MQKHDSKLTFHLYCLNQRVQSLSFYLLKCKSNSDLEWLQMQFDDPMSFLECIWVYSNPYFDLKLTETLPLNRVADLVFDYGSWWWRCSGSCVMDWMSSIWHVDGVWPEKLESARVDFDLASFGSKWPLMEFYEWFHVWDDLGMCEWFKQVCFDV